MFFKRNKWPRIKDFWFSTQREIANETDCDFVQYHDMPFSAPIVSNLLVCRHCQTLINDLSATAEELLENCQKNTKYEIRRAQKEGCFCKFFMPQQLTNDALLHKIDKAHAQMFCDKGRKSKSEYPVMSAANQAHLLAISVGYLADGRECAYHVYMVGNKTARLLHSISTFRQAQNNNDKNAIGRLNRYLHYQDLCTFKSKGYLVYDWGGYSEEKHLKSISDFKASFGGNVRDTFTWVYATSWLAKFISPLVKFWKFK